MELTGTLDFSSCCRRYICLEQELTSRINCSLAMGLGRRSLMLQAIHVFETRAYIQD